MYAKRLLTYSKSSMSLNVLQRSREIEIVDCATVYAVFAMPADSVSWDKLPRFKPVCEPHITNPRWRCIDANVHSPGEATDVSVPTPFLHFARFPESCFPGRIGSGRQNVQVPKRCAFWFACGFHYRLGRTEEGEGQATLRGTRLL